MTPERAQFLPGSRVPESDGLIHAGTGQKTPVRRNGDTRDLVVVARQVLDEHSRSGIPNVKSASPTRDQESPIVAEHQAQGYVGWAA